MNLTPPCEDALAASSKRQQKPTASSSTLLCPARPGSESRYACSMPLVGTSHTASRGIAPVFRPAPTVRKA